MNDAKKSEITAAVIVAAGRGSRIGNEGGPKQYRDLGDESVLARTVEAFQNHPSIDHIIVVIHQDDHNLYELSGVSGEKLLSPVNGGETRQQSTHAGLKALENIAPRKVLIHDAARPFVDHALLSRVVGGLDNADAILPALPIVDTLKRMATGGQMLETVSRENLYAAQTPQGFDFNIILAAHDRASTVDDVEFTDDAAIAEWAEIPVKLVEGSRENIKITTKTDLEDARAMVASKRIANLPDVRVGHGYDTHQLVEGNSIWLCGVELAHTHSLSGHSDADVGLHALTDALLATIADGDIGSHFPPSDETWKGARSNQFLKHAVDLVVNAGGTITHMDVTLLCETPKIGPHRDAMRKAMAKISGVDISRISVKATTNERIGFVGREEGMVALATATVVMETQ